MKEPLVHITARIPKSVADHFRAFPSFSLALRKALEQHVAAEKKQKENDDSDSI
jgi:hypothetical protein|tara:strand:- start:3857 stop:4018 length:162 start_codon:yes stop_codon:yes gene_type:complete